MIEKPRITTKLSIKPTPGFAPKFECRGVVMCPVMNKPVNGYGYGTTMEQAYHNWLNSAVPF